MIADSSEILVAGTGHLRGDLAAGKMFFHGLDRSRAGVRLCVNVERRALLRHPPVIKQTRDVPNLSWLDLLGAAQNEVVVLGSLEAGAKSGTLNQLGFENPEVREKILG